MQKKRKQRVYKYSILVADFETTHHKEFTDEQILFENRDSLAKEGAGIDFTPNESSKMFLAGLESVKTREYLVSYENMVDFFNNIANIAYKEHHWKVLCYFHNLAYDGSYILNWLLQHDWKQTLNTNKFGVPVLKHKEFSCLISSGKFFNLTMVWRGVTIIFEDSLKLFPMTLAKLGEEIAGMPKLKETVDYSEFDIKEDHNYPEEWLTYLKRDVDILSIVMDSLYKNEKKINTKRQTIGSISYSYVKAIVENKTPNFTIADYRLFEHWYHGGLCFPSFDAWAKWITGDIGVYDITSSYPNSMTKYLPFGTPFKEINPNWKNYCAFYKIHIKEAVIKKEYNSFACMWRPFEIIDGKKYIQQSIIPDNYQYLQTVKDCDYYVTDIELEMFEKLYDIEYNIIDTWYFETDNYLEATIREMFKAKDEAKKHNEPAKKLLAKLKLNNIYGKMGQKPDRLQDYYGDKKGIDVAMYEIVGKKNTLYEAYNIRKIKQDTDKARPIFVAAYITALSRVKLLNKIKEAIDLGHEFLYCDTDSIFIKRNNDKEVSEIGDELGNWENEANGKYFCSLCPKQYRLCDETGKIVKLASAGVSKQLMEKVKNIDYNYDVGDNKSYNLVKKQLKNSVNGKVIWDSPFNFKKWKGLKTNPILPEELNNGKK